MLYARYRWRRTFVAICGGRLDVISPSNCFCSCSFMVMSLRSVLLLSFRTFPLLEGLDSMIEVDFDIFDGRREDVEC